IAAPLKANAIRINDNIATFLNNIAGITRDVKGTIVWAADEVVYAPEVAVTGVHVDEIAGFMEERDWWLKYVSSRSRASVVFRFFACSPTRAPGIPGARSR